MSDVDPGKPVLAKVKSVTLGYQDYGILTSFLYLEYATPDYKLGSTSQGFGGYGLGGSYAHDWIEGVLRVCGVQSWDEVPGTWLWVEATRMKVISIKGVESGKTFNPSKWSKWDDNDE